MCVWIILGSLYILHALLCGSDLSRQLGLQNAIFDTNILSNSIDTEFIAFYIK